MSEALIQWKRKKCEIKWLQSFRFDQFAEICVHGDCTPICWIRWVFCSTQNWVYCWAILWIPTVKPYRQALPSSPTADFRHGKSSKYCQKLFLKIRFLMIRRESGSFLKFRQGQSKCFDFSDRPNEPSNGSNKKATNRVAHCMSAKRKRFNLDCRL